MKMAKTLLFSVTKKDFEIQTFRSGGPGGQNQNKVNSGVRLIHKASGATAESRETRSQLLNKKLAFGRLVASGTFKAWLKVEIARRAGEAQDIETIVDKMMQPQHLMIETIP